MKPDQSFNPLAEGDLLEKPGDPFDPSLLAIPSYIDAEFKDVRFEYKKREPLKNEGLRNACRLLFIGPPGTGKTAMARFLAHTLELDFFIVRGDRMVHSLYGHEERAMAKLWDQLQPADPAQVKKFTADRNKIFKEYYKPKDTYLRCEACSKTFAQDAYCGCSVGDILKQLDQQLKIAKDSVAPKVVFLDEAEAFLTTRGSSMDTPKDKAMSIFLQRLEAYWGDCIFVAATNMGNNIDPALWRRFDRVIEFQMPDKEQRKSAFAARLKEKVSDDALEAFSEESENLSFSEIRSACDSGLKRAILKDEMSKLDTLIKFSLMRERQGIGLRGKGHLHMGASNAPAQSLPSEPRSLEGWEAGNA